MPSRESKAEEKKIKKVKRLDRVRGVTCEEPLATAALKDPPMAAMGKGQWQGQGQSPSHVTPGLASGPPILTALASQVMAANPGHYVAVIIVAPPPSALNSAAASSSSTCNDGGGGRGARVKHLRLLRANDTLHIGHVYRLVSFQGAYISLPLEGGGGSKSSYRAGGGGARDDGGRNYRRRHPDNEGQSWWSSIGTPWAVEASLAKHCRVRKLSHPSRLFQSICVGKGEAEVAVSSLSDVLPATVVAHPSKIVLPPGRVVEGSPGARPGAALACNRVHIHGFSRLRHPSKYPRALKVRVSVDEGDALFRIQTVEICFHK
ncbi:hypothetical protein BHE74_00027757 [Ensete ventricosum]|nr:hypothetical protein BHE74_00027757 [Ensete ventricosum]